MAFDTSYLYFRAFFGVPATFRSPVGRPVNAVRGTLDFISRLAKQYGPDQLACAWDDDWRPEWRVELIDSYKTHRVAEQTAEGPVEEVDDDLAWQVPHIRACLDAVGLPIIGAPDHEADDVLASLAAHNDGLTLVVTGDRDLFQLVGDQTQVVYVARGVAKHELVTTQVLTDKYDLAPGRYVDFAVLRGDPSDGLPGVKGIGDKSAAQLVASYPSLDAMVAAAEDPVSPLTPAMRKKLIAGADYLPRAERVVTAVSTLDLPTPKLGEIDEDRVAELTQQLGLGGALTRLADYLRACSR